MSRRLLIIGGSAALGQELVRQLATNPKDFVVFVSSRNAPDPLDLRNKDHIFSYIERTRPDMIISLAATFANEFDEAYSINVNASRLILTAIKELGLSTRVVLVGSAAEYGIITPDENPVSEQRVLRPVSIYGMSKAWQTELACMYARQGSDVVIARVFNLLGSGLSERLFVGRLHKQISELLCGNRERIEVGPLSAIRDYISLEHAVNQLMAIAERGSAGEVYHIASGMPVTMRELLARELARYGLRDSIVVEAAALSNRYGYDAPSIYADIGKTTALL